MTTKRCPFCGEYVQSNSLTCPKCFRDIHREQKVGESCRTEKAGGGKSPDLVTFLAIFPAFIGMLGLGMIYLDPKDSKGYWFLAAGSVLFLSFLVLFFVMLDSGLLSAVMLFATIIIILLIYISAAAAAFIETVFGPVLKILRF
jgi:hypothetical protein